MVKTRKVQVTLRADEYDDLARIARQEKKKLAAVVRESIRKYVLQPEDERARRRALDTLLSLPPTGVPENYRDWEEAYSGLKTKSSKRRF